MPIHARFQGLFDFLRRGRGRQRDEGDVGRKMLPDTARGLGAGHFGHLHIHQDQVEIWKI